MNLDRYFKNSLFVLFYRKLNFRAERSPSIGMEHWQFWSEKWDTSGDAFWHLSVVNKHLKAHFHHFLAAKVNNGSNVCRVLVPLCGKTVDMKW